VVAVGMLIFGNLANIELHWATKTDLIRT